MCIYYNDRSYDKSPFVITNLQWIITTSHHVLCDINVDFDFPTLHYIIPTHKPWHVVHVLIFRLYKVKYSLVF